MNDAAWLAGVKRLRAIAQTGLTYSQDPYDLERYRELQILAERMLASLANVPVPQIHDLFLEEKGYPTPKVDVRPAVSQWAVVRSAGGRRSQFVSSRSGAAHCRMGRSCFALDGRAPVRGAGLGP